MNNKTREYRARTVVIDVANNKLVSSSHRCADDVLPTTVHCRVMLTEESLHTVLSSFFFFFFFCFFVIAMFSDVANSFDDGTAESYCRRGFEEIEREKERERARAHFINF